MAQARLIAFPSRAHLEEKRLADHRLDRLGIEGLRDQEGRLRFLPSQQHLGMTRNEDDRRFKFAQDLVHGLDAGAAIRKLDVG